MQEHLLALNPDKWVEKYADILYAYTIVRVNDVQQAEDIVQNVFLSAWKARDTYKGQASEKNWLYAILKNKIVDHFRKQSASRITLATGEEELYFDESEHWTDEAAPKDWGSNTVQPVESKEFYSILEQCRQKLKDIQQKVFVMKYMEDADSEEICKLLNITASNYWVLIHRAKLHLRKCLEKNWIGIN
ncbi:MAG: sigma-70 family RNA polymerase sigma factor [Chitinophagaceae bacterium]|nr:sigma-70 family RNA polymerase sigma factor [Chitinophagaceae bacterium]